MVKKTVRIALVDFGNINTEMRFFLDALKGNYNLVEDYHSPEILFYSCFGMQHLKWDNCIKVFVCQENVAPDFNECDYAISSLPLQYGDRHLFLPPCIAPYLNRKRPELPPIIDEHAERMFCTFIYSHSNGGKGSIIRKDFCEKLMRYKRVDCPGRVLHNMNEVSLSGRYSPNWHESKINFLSRYKFNIAFENSYTEGYVTEKLMDCYYANTIPIYWGGDSKYALSS